MVPFRNVVYGAEDLRAKSQIGVLTMKVCATCFLYLLIAISSTLHP